MRPPSTTHVAAAVVTACRTGWRLPTRSTTTPKATTPPLSTVACTTPASLSSRYSTFSTRSATWPKPATGCRLRGSPNAPSAATPSSRPTARATLTTMPPPFRAKDTVALLVIPGMLRARRRGFFKRVYEISSDGAAATSLQGGRREGCEFSLSGTGFRIERDGRKRFLLLGPDGRLATAERQTGREWAVRAATGNLTLVKPSIWRSGWEVQQRGSRKGEIRSRRRVQVHVHRGHPGRRPTGGRRVHAVRGPGDLRTRGRRGGRWELTC